MKSGGKSLKPSGFSVANSPFPLAAFGLVTFLMHENLDRARIRKHLLTFAFSAPVTALLTFILLVANKGDAADEASEHF